MSAEDYRARASEICRDGKAATAKLPTETETDAELADQLRKLLDINARTREDFGELDPPEDLQDAHDDLLAANDKGVEITEGMIERLEDGEKRAVVFEDVGREILAVSKDRDAAAASLGLPACQSDRPQA